ncbi:MAG: hypothetical protein ACK504_08435 [Bacteroidota bacterium]
MLWFFNLIRFIKTIHFIFTLFGIVAISCTGSKKYFRAAEKIEKQGLVNEAAQYYYESLERKKSNTKARIKLKEVGQKHINNLSSEFFREFNTQQYEQSIETFDNLKNFVLKSNALNVDLTYPKAYQDDYNKALEYYLSKNYNEANELVNQNKFDLALKKISKIKKYDSNYKNTNELETVSNCEPLYLIAIREMELQNYKSAQNNLNRINSFSNNYKDAKELLDLTTDLLKKTFIIFEPKNSNEKEIEDRLLNHFIEYSFQNSNKIKLINNSPFLFIPNASEMTTAGNIDLTQAIKKATGADYFYVFDVLNKREVETPLSKTYLNCFEKTITKKDTILVTEYISHPYIQVKGKRSYAYDLRFKVIDANTNQIVTSQSTECNGLDEIDYYEFNKIKLNAININNYFPYNPLTTLPINQYNANNWRSSFNNRKELKSFIDLRAKADRKAVDIFSNTLNNYIFK